MEYDIEKILYTFEDDYNPSSMVQGPRNMADGGVIGKPGGIVEHGVEYYGKSYKPGNPAYEAALEKSRQLSKNAPEGMKYDRKLKKYVKSKQKIRTKEINKIQENVLNFVNKKLKNKKYVSIPEIAKNVKDLNLKEGTLSPDKKSSAIIRRALENEKYRNKPILNLLGKQEYQDTRAAGFLRKAKTLVSDQEKILDLAMSGKYKTADEIKKATNLPTKKFEKELIKLYSNIYEERNRVNQGLKKFSVFLPRDEKQLKNILNVFADIDGFQGPETRSIFKLVRETYGKEGTNPNMKKYKEATSKLIDYYGTVKEIQKKHPTIKLDLDHPLDFKTIEGLGKKGEKFLHITPVSENLNRGLFKVIGTQYRSALESGDAKFIQNVEKLADDLGINIGKVKGKRIKDFGTSIIGESDFKKEIIENLKKQNVIADKVNPMQKSGELKKRLLEIGVKKPKDYNIEKINTDLLKLAGTKNKKCKGLLSYGGRVALAEGLSPEFCINEGKKVARDLVAKNIKASPAQNLIMNRITSGVKNFAKSILNPEELFDFKKQFLSKGALIGAVGIDAIFAADDALRKDMDPKEAFAKTLFFGNIPRAMGFTDNIGVINAKKMLENPNLSPAGKEYAQLIIDSGDYEKMQSDTTGGMTKKFTEFTEMQEKIKNASTAGRFDYENALAEMQGTFKAKPKENKFFFDDAPDAPDVTPLTNKLATPAKSRGPMTEMKKQKVDLTPTTYQNYKPFSFTKEEFEDTMRQVGLLKEGQVYNDDFYKEQIEAPMKASQFKEYMELPSFRGTQEKFSEGGIASLNVKK